VRPERSVANVLAEARERASANQDAQILRVAQSIGRAAPEIAASLEDLVDQVEIRVTRGLSICRHLREELDAGRIPTIRSLFETGHQDHTDSAVAIAAAMAFRQKREEAVFGADVPAMEDEDRPKYGFAYFSGTPTEPLPFGPVCFILNLDSTEMRERLTLTPVDSSIAGLRPEEVGTLDHPLNALARSSDALRACHLLADVIPPDSGIRDNSRQGTPEGQVWGPLRLTAEQAELSS